MALKQYKPNTPGQRGLVLVGIDIIGNKLTEINVTSPTGFREIKKFSNINLAEKLINSLT